MRAVVINRNQQEFVAPMRASLSPLEPVFVFDRCEPVDGCVHVVNRDGEGFLAGRMRDLGAEGIDDDILFLDGDKVPMGDIVADIESLKGLYDCICYGIDGSLEHSRLRSFMREDGRHGIVDWQARGFPYAYGCYSCGLWVCRDAVRKLRELNGGRIFHPAFDGTWGDEDNFLADELGYSGFRIGYSTRVRLAGSFGSCDDKQKFDGYTANFIKRIGLRRNLLGAPA